MVGATIRGATKGSVASGLPEVPAAAAGDGGRPWRVTRAVATSGAEARRPESSDSIFSSGAAAGDPSAEAV